MKENFIKTLSVASHPYIFRYELHTSEKSYTVSVLNSRDITPFEMVETSDNNWAMQNVNTTFLKDIEDSLSAAIVAENSLDKVASL